MLIHSSTFVITVAKHKFNEFHDDYLKTTIITDWGICSLTILVQIRPDIDLNFSLGKQTDTKYARTV